MNKIKFKHMLAIAADKLIEVMSKYATPKKGATDQIRDAIDEMPPGHMKTLARQQLETAFWAMGGCA